MIFPIDVARNVVLQTLPTREVGIDDNLKLTSLGVTRTDVNYAILEIEDELHLKFPKNYYPTTIGDILRYVSEYMQ